MECIDEISNIDILYRGAVLYVIPVMTKQFEALLLTQAANWRHDFINNRVQAINEQGQLHDFNVL